MSDDEKFTTVILKNKLRERGLPTYGTKAELIKRLNDSDPSGAWKRMASENQAIERDTSHDPEGNEMLDQTSTAANTELMRREMEVLRREKNLLERELQLAYREAEAIRRTPSGTASSISQSKLSVKSLGELIDNFNGSENTFEK